MTDNNSFNVEKKVKIYNIAEFVCVVALTVLCTLLFVFFATPVFSDDLGGDFGGDLGLNVSTFSFESDTLSDVGAEIDEPVLNVYTSTSKDNDLLGISDICIALIVFACLALVYAVFDCLVYRRSYFVPDRRGNLNRMFVLNCGAALVHLVFLILGAVMIGKIKDEGAGLMVAGAAPVLITVFSAVFFALTAAALVYCYLLAGRHADDITARKLARVGMTVDRSKDISAQLEYNRENYELNKLVNAKNRRLRAIDNTEKAETDKLNRMKQEHEAMPRVGNVTLDNGTKLQFVDKFKSMHRIYTLSIMCFPIILELLCYTLLIPLFVYKGNAWKSSVDKLKSYKKWLIATIVIPIVVLIGLGVLIGLYSYVIEVAGVVAVEIAFFTPPIIVAIVGLKKLKKLTVDLYGTAKPHNDAKPCVDIGDLSDFYIAQSKTDTAQKATNARAEAGEMFDSLIAAQKTKLASVAERYGLSV